MRSAFSRPRTPGTGRKLLQAGACAAVVALGGCEELPEAPNLPPTASFVFSPVSPIVAGESSVGFNAAASADTDGNVVEYAWEFGDGTARQVSGSPTIGHVFPDTATTCRDVVYTVQLTVTDDQGSRGFASQQVTVTELPFPNSSECTQPPQR